MKRYGRYVVAVLAGVLLALAFPKAGIEGFAWLAPGLMLAVAAGTRGWTAFRLGYLAGLAFHLTALYWLLLIPIQVGPETGWLATQVFRLGPVVGWLALSGVVALYPACWVAWSWRLYPVRFDETPSRIVSLVDAFLEAGRWQRMSWALAVAAMWVALEMVQARLFTGFPWNLLGASQYTMLPLIQVASFTGVYGVSFLVVWFSVSILGTMALMVRQPARRESWMLELILPILCVAAALSWGMKRLSAPKADQAAVKLALVQPSIPQTLIWDPAANAERFGKLLELSATALTNTHPDVLVWPEAAVPGFAYLNTNLNRAVTRLARAHRVWLVIGSDDAARAEHPKHPDDCVYFNSAFLVRPDGVFAASYRKRKLVMFGEFVPLADWLPFLKYLTPIPGGFTAGKRPVPFVLPELGIKTSALICFEDIFPHLVRQYVEPDTDFLINLTNNGWFGESAAQWQHAANAVFRAIENGLPLVRCANNGLTCWVDARGRLHEVFFPGTTDIYGVGVKVATVPVLAGAKRELTFYTRFGDWFGWTCVGLSAFLLLGQCKWRFRNHG